MKLPLGLLLVLGAGAAFVGAVLFWPTGVPGPEPIAFGRDACAHCRMHLAQPGFAGEILDASGRIAKYDDIGCMLPDVAADPGAPAWVEDHAGGGFVAIRDAVFVRTRTIRTPMDRGIVAFKEKAAADKLESDQSGTIVPLAELLRDAGSGRS